MVSDKPRAESLKTWLESRPYWEQYLWQLHIGKEYIEETDLDTAYQYLLEGHDVIEVAEGRTPFVFPTLDLETPDSSEEKITLDKIENLRNVNAIAKEYEACLRY